MKAKGNFMKIFEAVVLKRIDSGQEEVNQKLCYGIILRLSHQVGMVL